MGSPKTEKRRKQRNEKNLFPSLYISKHAVNRYQDRIATKLYQTTVYEIYHCTQYGTIISGVCTKNDDGYWSATWHVKTPKFIAIVVELMYPNLLHHTHTVVTIYDYVKADYNDKL